jgi:pimeloyl-ACP methyl ester carboxylesterase
VTSSEINNVHQHLNAYQIVYYSKMKVSIRILLVYLSLVNSFTPPLPEYWWKRSNILDLKGYSSNTRIGTISFITSTTNNHTKPPAFFIPGLEFSAMSLSQFKKQMQDNYSLYYVCSDNVQTEPIQDIVKACADYINKTSLYNVTVIGESSGAIMALMLGLQCENVNGVVLINSATAYPKTQMESGVNMIRQVREWEYRVAVIWFLCNQNVDICSIVETPDSLFLMLRMLINILYFAKYTLIKRIDLWIQSGIETLAGKLDNYRHPVLIIASKKDEMFSSIDEAKRLHSVLPNSTIVHVPACGHLVTPEKLPLCRLVQQYMHYPEV